MTTTQELKRYKYGYSSDEWGMGRSLGLIADPAGNVCLFADALTKLEAAQAENAAMEANQKAYVNIHAAWLSAKSERDAALARLAVIEKQEPVAWGNIADGFNQADRVVFVNKTAAEKYGENCYKLEPLYLAAGASPQPAQPSQARELDYDQKAEIVSNWFSDEDMQSRAMQMLGDIERARAAINAKRAAP